MARKEQYVFTRSVVRDGSVVEEYVKSLSMYNEGDAMAYARSNGYNAATAGVIFYYSRPKFRVDFPDGASNHDLAYDEAMGLAKKFAGTRVYRAVDVLEYISTADDIIAERRKLERPEVSDE